MKSCCAFGAIAASFLTTTALAEGEHAHHKCACEAEEMGVKIDCTNQEAMTDALALLMSDGCSTQCESEACRKNFLIIQSHHDFCLHDEVPQAIEEEFHDFENACEHCDIARRFDPELLPCPTAICDGGTGESAFEELKANSCTTDCSSTVCKESYRILRSEHDSCTEENLSAAAGIGIHDYEEPCEKYNCNVFKDAIESERQLGCTEHDDHDDHDDAVNAAKSSVQGWLSFEAPALTVMLALIF